MKNKKYSLFVAVIVIVILVGVSCSSENYLPATSTPLPTNEISFAPSTFPTSTPVSTFTMMPSPTVVTPYPTASAVKANAVAFTSQADGKASLWVANLDGSGEKQLVDSFDDTRWNFHGYAALEWSPNGKWISYLSSEELWIVSPDGSVNKKILSFPDKSKGTVYMYQWSPDSSQIAYIQAGPDAGLEGNVPIIVGLLYLETGKTLELSSYNSPTPVTFSWSPDGRYLLLSKMSKSAFSIFDITTHEVIKEIGATGRCSAWHHGVSWSPNSKWFYDIQAGNGRFATTQICVAGLDGLHRQIDIDGTITSDPVWDKSGNFLYFVVANTDFSITPLPDYDLRLIRYDVRTQEEERLFSLGKEPYSWHVSISPNGSMLELDTYTNTGPVVNLWPPRQYIFMTLDIQSLSTRKFTVDFGLSELENFDSSPVWSPDNNNIIFYVNKPYSPNYSPNGYATYYSFGSFYALDTIIGKTTIVSGVHSVENAQFSPSFNLP